jgi:hypothetical protein
MKGFWHEIWLSNENYGSKEEVGLDNVDPVGITQVLESHSHAVSIEELYDLTQQLTEQQEEDEDKKDRRTMAMQKKTLLIFFPL